MRFLIAVFVLLVGSVPASAQSFNCRYAKLPTEVAICQNHELGRLDQKMASLFYGLPRHLRVELKGSQARWLRRRNACGYNFDCIERAYRRRIRFLSEY